MKRNISIFSLLFMSIVFLLQSCKKNQPESSSGPRDTPNLKSSPPNYLNSSNDHLAELGRVLFYDPKLSSDNTIRCGSCHMQERAFADGNQFSTGVNGQIGTRNAPTIFPKSGHMFWDGKAKNLSEMVIMPISNHIEMNIQDFDALCIKLGQNSYYKSLFKNAFKDENISKDRIREALQEFVSNFQFNKNKFNAANPLIPNPFASKLSKEETAGKNLFFGKAKCADCHHIQGGGKGGYGVTDESHNIGLDYESLDKGVGEVANDPDKNGQFMMPILLNIELTGPYMHDGRFQSLEEVVEHYNSKVVLSPTIDWRLLDYSDFNSLPEAIAKLDLNRNGMIDKIENQNRGSQRLNLSEEEKNQLVIFMRTLTDKNILTDTKFSDPFK